METRTQNRGGHPAGVVPDRNFSPSNHVLQVRVEFLDVRRVD